MNIFLIMSLGTIMNYAWNWVLKVTPHLISYSSCWNNRMFLVGTASSVTVSSSFFLTFVTTNDPNLNIARGVNFLAKGLHFIQRAAAFQWAPLEHLRPENNPRFGHLTCYKESEELQVLSWIFSFPFGFY